MPSAAYTLKNGGLYLLPIMTNNCANVPTPKIQRAPSSNLITIISEIASFVKSNAVINQIFISQLVTSSHFMFITGKLSNMWSLEYKTRDPSF